MLETVRQFWARFFYRSDFDTNGGRELDDEFEDMAV